MHRCPPVTGTSDRDWVVDCERLFDITPPPMTLRDRALKLTWFRKQFLVDLLTDMQAQQHACAYIIHMIGTTLFLDYSTNMVYLRWLPLLEDFDVYGAMSWGSIVLAFLYRELYKNFTTRTSQSVDTIHSCS